MRLIAATLLAFSFGSWAYCSCWNAIDPNWLAERCPIIVTAAIESVTEAARGGERSDDIAHLRIITVERNELSDVVLKAGDLFAVRMISKNNRLQTSTDIHYPTKTKALWLILLTSKGQFRIDVRPEQKQPMDAKFGRVRKLQKDARATDPQRPNPAGSKTKAAWVAWMAAEEERQAKAMAIERARQAALRELVKLLADAPMLNEPLWRRYLQADVEVRRDIFQVSIHQHISASRLAELAEGALMREPDDNVRTHAVNQLAYCKDPGAKGMKVLSRALGDRSASVRLFACQAVKLRRYEQLADQVRQLRTDPDQQVRAMANDTLEHWRSPSRDKK